MIRFNDILEHDQQQRRGLSSFSQAMLAKYRRRYPVTYIVRLGEAGPVKIGYAEDALKRIKTFQTGHPERYYLIRWLPGGLQTERWLHECFAASRVRGEWFSLEDRMLSIEQPDFELLRCAHLPFEEWLPGAFDVCLESFMATITELQRLASKYSDPAAQLYGILLRHAEWRTDIDRSLGDVLGVHSKPSMKPHPNPDQPGAST